MDESKKKPLRSLGFEYNFGRHLGSEIIGKIGSYQGWVSLYVTTANSTLSRYPASHPLQALRVAQLTEVFVAMELAIPLSPPREEDHLAWESMWKSAQAYMAFYEDIPHHREAVDMNVEDSMTHLLADVASFVPRAVREKPLVSTLLLSGAVFARAIDEEMQNMGGMERGAFEEVWSIADRIQLDGSCWRSAEGRGGSCWNRMKAAFRPRWYRIITRVERIDPFRTEAGWYQRL